MAYDGVDRILHRDQGVDGVIGEIDVETPTQLFCRLHDRQRVGAELLEVGFGHDRVGRTTDDAYENVRELFVD